MTDIRDRKTFITLAYGGLLILCLLLGTKVIDLGPVAADGSQLPYALLLALVAIVTEVEGSKSAQRLIYAGLVFQAIAFALIAITLALPFSDQADPERSNAFTLLVGQNTRMILAGITSYLIVTTIIRKVQFSLAQKSSLTIGKRSLIANVTGQAFDTVIYLTIAFYAIHPLPTLMTGQFLVKTTIAILIVPFLVRFGTTWFAGNGEFPQQRN